MRLIPKYQQGNELKILNKNQVESGDSIYTRGPTQTATNYDKRNNVGISVTFPNITIKAKRPSNDEMGNRYTELSEKEYNKALPYYDMAKWVDTSDYLGNTLPKRRSYLNNLKYDLYYNPTSTNQYLISAILGNTLLQDIDANTNYTQYYNWDRNIEDKNYFPLNSRNPNLISNTQKAIDKIRDEQDFYSKLKDNSYATASIYNQAGTKFINKAQEYYDKDLPNKYLVLRTYYPFINKEVPLTGHSQLETPVSQISNFTSNEGYNLVTNNCADATRRALNALFRKTYKPSLFTTPGNVRNFALNNLGGYVYTGHKFYNEPGLDRVIIPITDKQEQMLSSISDTGISRYIHKGTAGYSKGGIINNILK
jgi:hypothetical protein